MSSRMVSWKLRRASARLRSVRAEIEVADAQLAQLAEMADDTEVDAVVQGSSGAIAEHRQAREHADAMRLHRARLGEQATVLERRVDDLLDALRRTEDRPS